MISSQTSRPGAPPQLPIPYRSRPTSFRDAWSTAEPTIRWRLWQLKYLGGVYKKMDAFAPKWYKESFRPRYTTRMCMLFGHKLAEVNKGWDQCTRPKCRVLKGHNRYGTVPQRGVMK